MHARTALKTGPGSIELKRSPSPLVKAEALLFAHFERPDLRKAEDYLLDFGLVPAAKTEKELFFRGTGANPYIYRIRRGPKARFLGIGLSVPKAGDLETLSRKFGVPVERADGPGGGSVVHLRDRREHSRRAARLRAERSAAAPRAHPGTMRRTKSCGSTILSGRSLNRRR